jgi:pimeloyl-ACP methyl ester carboxylesterase
VSDVVATKNKRGRETTGDMVRSLGLVLLAVVAIWFLARPPESDVKALRVIDPVPAISAFTADVPGAVVPGTLPAQWRPTSSKVDRSPDSLRVGYVTPSGEYAEYAASTAPRAEYVPQATGEDTERLDPVQVAGGTWEQYAEDDGSLSLVRAYGPVTVVVGTTRATAPLAELRTLVESLTPR